MNNLFDTINWMEKSESINRLSNHNDSLTIVPLDSGLEAEVTKITISEFSVVLKVWNKTSKPNIEYQYKLLDALYTRGLSVTKPLGWGLDKYSNSVLLTSFDGAPIVKVNKSMLTMLASLLMKIHQVPTEQLETLVSLKKHDFISYFYPAIEKHVDIRNHLEELVKLSGLKQDRIIHGDYNLGNILIDGGNYTIIDWTNGQLGDPRYDIAWSTVLMRIYVGERYGSIYRSSFLLENQYTSEELELFEAIACLRWILLNRITTDLPKGKDTYKNVKNILQVNKYLNENFL